MTRLSRVTSATAHYVERKELAMLSAPLESKGTLTYVAPDHLEKKTESPRAERFIIEGDRMTVEQEGAKPRRFSLAQAPELGAMIESIRATLAGDADALERYYTVQVEGSLDDWQILLLPKSPRLQGLVTSIRISGHDASIHEIETLEQGGDRTITTIMRDEFHEANQ